MRHVKALLVEPTLVSFHHFINRIAPGIMKVKRLDLQYFGLKVSLLKRITHPP